MNEADMPYSACIRCQTCDGFPCLVHAKSDAEVIAVRPAIESPNVTLLRNAFATRLETNASGTAVVGVIAEVAGKPERFEADIVVVSCGAANSAALLLRSANERHPNGLANGSGQVGRHYMFHNSQAVLALSLTPNDTMFQKTLALNDFYFGMEGFPYPMGNIQMIGKTLGGMYRAEKPLLTALVPDRALDEIARHAVDFWLTTEDLPDPDNRVTIERDGRLKLAYKPNNQVPMQKLYEKLKSMLEEIGLQRQHLVARDLYMRNDIPLAGCAHQAGTCRFGDDPAASVLDRNCKAHELDNLYVVDTSFFVSIGAVNPSLTAIANALRVGDHICEEDRRMTAAALATLAVRYLLVMLFFPFSAADKIFNFDGAVAQARQIAPRKIAVLLILAGVATEILMPLANPDRNRGPGRRFRDGRLLHGDGVAVEAVLEAGRLLARGRQQGPRPLLGFPQEFLSCRGLPAVDRRGSRHDRDFPRKPARIVSPLRAGANAVTDPGFRPTIGYWHLWRDDKGVSHQQRCELTAFELKGVGPADPQWNNRQLRSEATTVFTVQPVGWVGDWHENPAPQWIVPLSGRWWVEAMDGTRVEMGPGDLSFGEDQGCIATPDGRRGHRSGTIGDQPAVLITVQVHVPPVLGPCHLR